MADEEREFKFEAWAKENGLVKKTTAVLVRENVNTDETLRLLSDDDITCLGLTLGQRKLLAVAVRKLRSPPEEAIADITPHQPVRAFNADETTQDGIQVDRSQDRNTAPDVGKSLCDLIASVPNILRQPRDVTATEGAAAMDPRATLALKATNNKVLHITDFLPESVRKRRMSRQREMVLTTGGNSEDVLVLRTEDSHPYSGLTLSEWGAANCRVMAALLDRQMLAPQDVHYYLAYTTRIFEWCGKYEWDSVLEYDNRYREIQAEHGLKWGVHSPDLELHILERRQRPLQRQQNGKTRAAGTRPPPPLMSNQLGPREECRQYKAMGWCRFGADCRYSHPPVPAPANTSLPGQSRQ